MGQSRNENILENMLGAENELAEPQSRVEELLIDIYNQGAGLPDVDSADNGKVLAVVNGNWDKSAVPSGNLPVISSADEGKFLRVKTSGGVTGWLADNFDDFDKVRKNTYNIKADILEEGYINGSGINATGSTYRRTDFIPVKSGEVFAYKLSHNNDSGNLPIIAFYSSAREYDLTNSIKSSAKDYASGTAEVPSDGFVRFVYYTGKADVFVKFESEIPTNVSDALGSAVDDSVGAVSQNVYAIKNNITSGWIGTDGTNKSTGNYKRTDYIAVKSGETINYRLSHGVNNAPMIAFYNSSKQVILF